MITDWKKAHCMECNGTGFTKSLIEFFLGGETKCSKCQGNGHYWR